jgi:hypothetical protein
MSDPRFPCHNPPRIGHASDALVASAFHIHFFPQPQAPEINVALFCKMLFIGALEQPACRTHSASDMYFRTNRPLTLHASRLVPTSNNDQPTTYNALHRRGASLAHLLH